MYTYINKILLLITKLWCIIYSVKTISVYRRITDSYFITKQLYCILKSILEGMSYILLSISINISSEKYYFVTVTYPLIINLNFVIIISGIRKTVNKDIIKI